METNTQLELIKFAVQEIIGKELIYPNAEISEIPDPSGLLICIRVTGKLLGELSIQRHEFQYPANWKEAFKERWLPGFLIKIFPVKYTVHVVEISAVYHELHKKLKLPSEPHFFCVSNWDV